MNTTYGATRSGQAIISALHVASFIRGCWAAVQERRKRARVQSDLHGLTDQELKDIGIARGEIDYVASNRLIDPRDVPWV